MTLHGKWMYPTAAVTLMTGRVRSGSLDLGHFEVRGFALDDANGAFAHAAEHGGPFRTTVIARWRSRTRHASRHHAAPGLAPGSGTSRHDSFMSISWRTSRRPAKSVTMPAMFIRWTPNAPPVTCPRASARRR
ncbi:hypothetical protein [Burkholderia cenocepacia]|uniref:hypothetical protein n=1 Tax=Burkholderia cenocepacia TaxID=95486 RepID=UPI001B9ED022|nr:hypothetical protein [Burkholderia cenocepacia]